MWHYLARRLLWMVGVLLGISFVTFTMIYILPGDPAQTILGPRASEEAIEAMRAKWGLDEPLLLQYTNYMSRLLRGDMGRSFYFKVDVLPAILGRLPATAILVVTALLISLLIGIPVGVISSVYQYSWLDRTTMITSLLGISLPAFFVGLLMIYVFGYLLDLFPLRGYGGIQHLVLPAITLGIRPAAWYARVLRSAMLDILPEDYMRTARAKGLSERRVLFGHALRNALGPVATMVGSDLGYLMGGTLVIEKVFSWPGVGYQAWNAIDFRDIPMIMGTVLFGAFFVAIANLAVDVIQVIVDPRIRHQ